MKTSAVAFILALAAICFAAEEKAIITIDGMSCNGCVHKVTTSLDKIDGVNTTEVTLKPGQAIVTYAADKTNYETLLQAIAALGYKASCKDKVVGKATQCKSHIKETAPDAASVSHHEAAVKVAPIPCPAVKTCKAAGTVPACGSHGQAKASISDHETNAGHKDHACPTITKCKELIEFHDTMHPLHIALMAGDYQSIRQGYHQLAERAKAVEHMKCDDKCVKKDVRDFEKKRKELLKQVDKFGQACQDDDDRKLTKAFDKMHDAYAELGSMCK